MKKALITGITGQDGSYLAELLLQKDYEVHGIIRRASTFNTERIDHLYQDPHAAAQIKAGLQDKLYLGNLGAKRDWGYAKQYVEAMWLMLQQDKPDDYVIATGETHSVGEFLEEAFLCAGLDWRKHVEIDPKYYRPAETDLLVGDAGKAKKQLSWEARTKFKTLVRLMTETDASASWKNKAMQIVEVPTCGSLQGKL